MQRGRKPKPTGLKLASGNPGKRSLNLAEAKPLCELPDPPEHLDGRAKREWARAGRELERCGLITRIDRAALAAYCQAYSIWQFASVKLKRSRMVINSPNGYPIQNPWLAIVNRAREDIRRWCNEFGMTPSSRSRAAVSEKRTANEGDGKARFFGRGKAS